MAVVASIDWLSDRETDKPAHSAGIERLRSQQQGVTQPTVPDDVLVRQARSLLENRCKRSLNKQILAKIGLVVAEAADVKLTLNRKMSTVSNWKATTR